MGDKPYGAGKSSIDLVDVEVVAAKLGAGPEMTLLDLGCGEGRYSLALAGRLGPGVKIIGVDLWQDGVEALRAEAARQGFSSIRAVHADAAGPLPIEDHDVDACLMATVFHDLVHGGSHDGALSEITRVMRPSGLLAVVEFKVMPGPPGPPQHVRIGPDKLARMIEPAGFAAAGTVDVGQHTYLSLFNRL